MKVTRSAAWGLSASWAGSPCHGSPCYGVTLLETLIAAAVLSFAVISVTQAVVAGQMQSAEALKRARAMALAESLTDEVLRLPHTDPNGGSEAGRTTYDNAGDFNGFSEAAGALADAFGTLYDSTHQGFSRSVSVASSNITVPGFGSAIPGVTITVTVSDGIGGTWALTRFKAQPPP